MRTSPDGMMISGTPSRPTGTSMRPRSSACLSAGGDVPLAVIFDGDDTLWITEPLYDSARRAVRQIVQVHGLDGEHWEEMERRIDVRNVDSFGHDPARFPASCREAYELLCAKSGVSSVAAVTREIEAAAKTVFYSVTPNVEDAAVTLQALSELGVKLGLLTKG